MNLETIKRRIDMIEARIIRLTLKTEKPTKDDLRAMEEARKEARKELEEGTAIRWRDLVK